MAPLFDSHSLGEHLDALEKRFNTPDFIASDPISIPHRFSVQGDVELSGFLVSLIAWGNRKMILRSGGSMLERMDNSPLDFITNATEQDVKMAVKGFVHRTFNSEDLYYIIFRLQFFLLEYGSLGSYFQSRYLVCGDLRLVLSDFRRDFFDSAVQPRTSRHLSSIDKGSACKRLCMYLRWMVRSDNGGVDFGLWGEIPSSALYIPLDVHSARQGRALGLLHRGSNDWRSVEELTASLRRYDSIDPVRYDFALFGLGVGGSE